MTVLVLSPNPDLFQAVRNSLEPAEFRVVQRTSVQDAEPFLVHGLAEICIFDADLTTVQPLWALERLRRQAPHCPVVIYSAAKAPEWEEEAYLRGASLVLAKPVRPRGLVAVVQRLLARAPVDEAAIPPAPPQRSEAQKSFDTTILPGPIHTMSVLRDVSGILGHSLNTEAMLKQFLLLLREILSVNRAAIFLRKPFGSPGSLAASPESQRLRTACAVGLSHGLLEHFELSFEAGIGAHLFRSGRVLRRQSEEARGDATAQKEFELLGAQVAVPVLDRETVMGVAVFDGRITGEPLENSELQLVFHLLEQVGLAVKNIWLHEQLATNHQMMTEILRELSSACVVVSRDLAVLHANKTARKYFLRSERRGEEMEFSDLPQVLGSKVYQVLKTGSAITSFRFEPEDAPGLIYDVSIVPFQREQAGLPGSALLMAEDRTQSEQLRRLELEAANLRLIRSMADRLTHEIGNAMVPLSTHQQLLADKWKDSEFRTSLDLALADGVKRVTRLIQQMRFLARDSLIGKEAFPLAPLLEEAYQEACKYQPVKSAQLRYDHASKPIVVTGDRAALKHAFTEIMLNALQANPAEPKIGVRLQTENGTSLHSLLIDVQDNGTGFTPEALQKAPAPFFTTRNVGLGLGLTVSRKIIETHNGKLEILPPGAHPAGIVRISLPLEASVAIQA